MKAIKDCAAGIFAVAGIVLYLAVASMIGVLPIIIGFWLWGKVLG